ncbi:response regulator [Candidatus Peregrinibacteria bacterium]|jgi:DNA-binding response OmpR family regulator|nr:response regulator [Candidatus Peregrinibacteria bacterium]MBT4367480.1 response regulator [Candidatus Peregrinibacteria bacterium]MBT4586072.1 response regulator [Candidatus Peregrinibacteria bacterium]MBT6730354.1 response regulator [Candidatus Peregrinibacteria bacterium]MBT7009016.1 response regulator [Candidatus Peregrinibacteria bacterium]
MKILLIEDSDLQATVFTFELKNQGHEVLRARDGAEGIEKIKSEKPDIVLLDIIMEGMDGFSLLAEREKNEELQGVPIIMLTDLRDPSDIENAKAMGASDYFVKNKMQIDELIKKMEQVLSEWKKA